MSVLGESLNIRPSGIAAFSLFVAGLTACGHSVTGPAALQTFLVSVAPPGGATSVSTAAPIVMRFSHAMQPAMQTYAALHQGDVTGPIVPCLAAWSGDWTVLTLTPSSPLAPATRYTLHIGGGMRDANGNVIDMSQYGAMMGGQWATGGMMSGGGMMGGGHEMGPGWQGTNGMYGMVFGFTTS